VVWAARAGAAPDAAEQVGLGLAISGSPARLAGPPPHGYDLPP